MFERRVALLVGSLACAACGSDSFSAVQPTDAGGAADTADAGDPTLARDSFTRNLSASLGAAELGGVWSLSGGAPSFGVDGQEATILLDTAGVSREAYLGTISTSDADVQATLWLDKMPTGSGVYFRIVGRRVASNDEYEGVVVFRSDGTVTCALTREPGSVLFLQGDTGVTVTPGDRVRARFQATGTSPTHLRVKVWHVSDPEPSAWNLESTDSAADLQGPGNVGLSAYLSQNATTAPTTTFIDDFLVRAASRVP